MIQLFLGFHEQNFNLQSNSQGMMPCEVSCNVSLYYFTSIEYTFLICLFVYLFVFDINNWNINWFVYSISLYQPLESLERLEHKRPTGTWNGENQSQTKFIWQMCSLANGYKQLVLPFEVFFSNRHSSLSNNLSWP